ncbi:YfhO family protein [Bacteroidota bacterium]
MNSTTFNKHLLPHIIAIILFVITVVIFYHPTFFEGKKPSMHDALQGRGSGQELINYRESTGEEGLWTNSMFGGMPGYLINVRWSGDLLRFPSRILTLGIPDPARYTFLAMICFYILLLAFRVNPYLAIGGAIAFGFNSFNIISIGAGHIWKVKAIAYMPLVLAGIHLSYGKLKWLGLSLTGLALGLQIRANHTQMTYYLLIMILLYLLARLILSIKEKTLVPFLQQSFLLIIPVLLAVGSIFGKIWTVMEYSTYSTRGSSELKSEKAVDISGLDKDYVFNYSNGIFEPLTAVVPNFMGGSSQQKLDKNSFLAKALESNGLTRKQIEDQIRAVPTYYGKQPLTAPYYLGAIVFFIFIIGLFTTDKYLKWWLVSTIILSVVLSWGKNFSSFNYLIYDILPGYNKFRSVTFTIVMAYIAVPLLGFIGLQNLINQNNFKKTLDILKKSALIVGSILLIILLYSWMGKFRGAIDENLVNIPDWFITALRNDRARLLRMDVIRSLVFIGLFIGSLYYYLKEKISFTFLGSILLLLVSIDLMSFDNRVMQKSAFVRDPISSHFRPTEADERILQDKFNFRVLNLQNPFNEARTSYFHHSIGGYHGAKMRRYQNLIENYLSPELTGIINTLQKRSIQFDNIQVLNMLNTRYFYYGTSTNSIILNENAFGNAWFVKSVRRVNNANDEISFLKSVDLRQEAVIDESKFKLSTNTLSGEGEIILIDYRPGMLRYESNNSDHGLAVFSEIYYPIGWSATIDGNEAEILRVNYTLRALEIPAGYHEIEFHFKPKSYHTGNLLMYIFSGMVILVFITSTVFTLKNDSL